MLIYILIMMIMYYVHDHIKHIYMFRDHIVIIS